MVKTLLTVLMLGCLWLRVAGATDVEVSVEPDPPVAGESFSLAFTARGDVSDEPDFTPLEAVVEILGRNRQTSIEWVNGKHSRTTRWVLDVLPRAAGDLVIPAISFGNVKSSPMTVHGAAGSGNTGQAGSPAPADDGVFLEVDASPRDPYVQQQVIYTIRLWRRYELSNATLSEPRLSADAIVRPLGEDRHYEDSHNGKRYEVIERRFALFPQASGQVKIEPVTVTAQVLSRALSIFDMFGRSVKTRRINSDSIALDVKPIPPAFPKGATWIPASKFRLDETWEPEAATAKVGEPITRTVTLWAEGLTPGQLPNLAQTTIADVKVYPDQPHLSEDTHNGVVTAVHQEKFALMPTGGRAFDAPALEIPWWNTATDALEVARLPARHFAVSGAATTPAAPAPIAAPAPPPSTRAVVTPTDAPVSAGPSLLSWRGWFWVAAASSLGWLLTGWGLYRRGRVGSGPEDTAATAGSASPSLRDAARAVERACHQRDPRAARNALLQWAKAHARRDRIPTFEALYRDAGADFAAALQGLDRALYAADRGNWDAAELLRAFNAEHLRHGRDPAREPSPLPPLFRLVEN